MESTVCLEVLPGPSRSVQLGMDFVVVVVDVVADAELIIWNVTTLACSCQLKELSLLFETEVVAPFFVVNNNNTNNINNQYVKSVNTLSPERKPPLPRHTPLVILWAAGAVILRFVFSRLQRNFGCFPAI
ncbi:unnamed protein product [Polarella glacialis]|uniref:Uncharacterized protein n=1 Tax=Polarella glacialis TaxID=89957 RepID=A0A813HR36_POLGL|nr:unnamed protein product [Polarella glacialis]